LGDPPRRIAVTGAAGFLGRATVARLSELPATELVAAVDLGPTPGPPGKTRRVVSVIRDVRSALDDVLAGYEIDAVVHLAYLLRPERDETLARSVNVTATERLLASCAAAGVKQFVYLSSTTVYGAHPSYSRPYTEDDPASPTRGFQYSEHKAAAEKLVLGHAAGDSGAAVSILRGCVIMAPGADNFIARSLGRRLLPAPMGASPPMQFLHLDDYVSAVEAALVQGARGIYNIAGDGAVPWRDVAAISGARPVPVPAPVLRAAVGLSWKLGLQGQSPASGLDLIRYPWLASTEKIKRDLGWSPRYTSEQALRSWVEARRGRGG